MFWIVLITCAALLLAVGAGYITFACFIAACSLAGYAAVGVFVVGVVLLYVATWLTYFAACLVVTWIKGGNNN
jgi:hypothetical protein